MSGSAPIALVRRSLEGPVRGATEVLARMVIEAAYGLGEVAGGGLVEPDTFVVVDRARQVIGAAERRVLLDAARATAM